MMIKKCTVCALFEMKTAVRNLFDPDYMFGFTLKMIYVCFHSGLCFGSPKLLTYLGQKECFLITVIFI